ncbi:hypothetical protein [Alienimonas sp. DA493]|uniref:hypothetical protein n=1 Tax=Alienimonas sp. DA493 TaxID=3373605 RepID=UPI003754E948
MHSAPPRARRTTRRVAAALGVAGLAALGGCEGNATVATPNDSGPVPGAHAAAAPPAAAPVAPAPAVREATPRRSNPRPSAPRRAERAPERRETAARTDRDRRAPATGTRSDGGSGVTMAPGVTKVPGEPDPFDPEIDPSTLSRPEPAAPPAEERPPELVDAPLTAPIPPDKQAIPDDLALPVGAVLYYQDGRGWAEVELKAPAPPRDGASDGEQEAASILRVHRTDRPAVIPDVRIARDQLIVTKLLVRRLESAR